MKKKKNKKKCLLIFFRKISNSFKFTYNKHICRKQQQLEEQLREELDQKKREELRQQWDKEEKERQEKMFVDCFYRYFSDKKLEHIIF